MRTVWLILGIAVLLAVTFARPAFGQEEAADQFDCAACHPLKLRDFKGRRSNPVVPVVEFPTLETGTQNVASSPAMCLSCHDGFVEDSRFVWEGEYSGHRVGMIPSSDIASANLDGEPAFPLNEDGNMYCGTCHTPHLSSAADAPSNVRPFMRASADGSLCQACHEDARQIAGSGHDKGSRRSKDYDKRGTCGSCHTSHGADLPIMWGRTLGQGELSADRFCTGCHDEGPFPGEHPAGVIAWSQEVRRAARPDASAALPVFDEGAQRSAVGHIGCPTCHNPHRERAEGRAREYPGMHLRMPDVVQPLCADCHGPDSLFLYKFFHSRASRR